MSRAVLIAMNEQILAAVERDALDLFEYEGPRDLLRNGAVEECSSSGRGSFHFGRIGPTPD